MKRKLALIEQEEPHLLESEMKILVNLFDASFLADMSKTEQARLFGLIKFLTIHQEKIQNHLKYSS